MILYSAGRNGERDIMTKIKGGKQWKELKKHTTN